MKEEKGRTYRYSLSGSIHRISLSDGRWSTLQSARGLHSCIHRGMLGGL